MGTGRTQICAAGTCGNGRLDPGEACDDGNNRSGDGCPADCSPPCGDGVLDPGEACDDGNTVDGDGCSADCRSLDGIFLVTPPMVSFTASEGGAPPAPITVKVRFEHRGDMMRIGYTPGAPPPTWLSIADGPTTATTAELELRATDTSIPGEQSTSVRLSINHPDHTGLKTFDLPVAYSVEPSDLAVQAAPAALAFTIADGGTGVASQAVDVTFNGADVTVVALPPWAAVSGPAAATSPASFAVSITDTSFAAGTVLSGDIVFRTRRDTLQRTTSVHVTCRVVTPPLLAIEAAPAVLAFTAFHDGAVPPPQSVSVTFNGDSIEVVETPPWVTVSAPDLVTSPASLTVSVNDTSFNAGTVLFDGIVLRTTRGASQLVTFVHVDYHVQPPAEVEFVAPYVGIAGRPGMLRLRGHDFRATNDLVTVGIGDLHLGPVVPDGDTQITVSYPALPAGRYPVSVVGSPQIAPTFPELVIVTPPAYGYQAIDAPSARARILYDAERQAIYGANTLDQRIEHFLYDNGAWSSLSPHTVSLVADIALAPNGRSLIVIDRDHVNEMSLTDNLFVLSQRASNPVPYFGGFCDQTAAADNGTILLLFGSSCSDGYLYDMQDYSLRYAFSIFGRGRVGASADGSRIYIGNDYYRLYNDIFIFQSLSNTVSLGHRDGSLGAITVSGNASRVILNDTNVYSRSLTLLGNLPGHGVALASRDSARAFVYVDDAMGARIEVYDLNGPVQADGAFPLLETVVLADSANGSGDSHPPVTMTSSLDDAVVFVSGDSKLLVVPVN